KVFKGNVKTDTIELTVRGGFYESIEPDEEYIPGIKNPFAGQKLTGWSEGKTFALHQYGTFFLKKNPNPKEQSAFKQIPNKYKYIAHWHRNYLWYDGYELNTIGPDMCTEHNKEVLERYYGLLKKLTTRKYKEINSLCKSSSGELLNNKQSYEQLVMAITGFSKDSVPAGTQTPLSHLTIYGSSFGNSVGEVHFKNANNGGANEVNISAKDILYWSDDSIRVHVPSMGDSTQLDRGAGSGVVKVVRAQTPTDSVTSAMGIVVPYSIKNTYARGNYFRPKLLGPHDGGYTVAYDSSFYNNKPALAAFRRALQQWRCTTGIHLREYCEKARPFCDTVGQSGFVRVGFAKNCFGFSGQPIYLGATATRITKACINTDTTLYVLGQDLLFADPPQSGFTWHFDSIPSTDSNKYDFETTALHELGHVHLLDHINDPSKNLYYGQPTCNQPNASIRTLSPSNEIAGGDFVMGHDTLPNPLCPQFLPMQRIVDCVLPAVCPPSGTCSIEDPALFNQPILTLTCPLSTELPTSGGLFGILSSTPIGIAASHTYNAAYTYEWDFGADATILSATNTSDYGPHEVLWETTGLKFVTLTVYNGNSCYGVAETIWVNDWQDCSDPLFNSFVSDIVQPTCSLPQGSFMLANSPLVGTLCYYYQIYHNGILLYEGTGTGSPLLFGDLVPGTYTIAVEDHISGCLSTEQVVINEVPAGSGKTDDETPCFIDLRMRDNDWDTGQEPNYSAGVDGDFDDDEIWEIDSPDDWEDIWYSPDLWNCDEDENCPPTELHNPRATVVNKLGFTIYNAHPDLVSDPAQLHLYYTLANTGEAWPDQWIDYNYLSSDSINYCYVGDEIVNSPVAIPAIDPQTTHTSWVTWSPPNFVNDSYPFYANPDSCGLSTEIDPADGEPKYEMCLLARLESEQDPIINAGESASTRDIVLNSNNIVTRNTFLIDPALGPGGGISPIIAGQPSIILVANNNDEVRNLDILFDKFTSGSVDALENILEISFVLSPDLWDKWQSTGAQGEGIQEIDTREVKITNMETAKLLDIPFDPREFQPFAIKVTILTSSGKRETLNYLPDNFGFRITHRSSDGSPINKPSNCLFYVNDLDKQTQTAQLFTDRLHCSPNPFSSSMNVQFYLEKEESITLVLYDLQGRLVKTIQSGTILAAGTHNISVNSGDLSNGVYICSLITETKQLNEKVVLVR
ncbi:MAG: T9SS type A sorting domain-containing protein, partial [Chitinophagales bacterium]|nr:T9SS type A sorting domain-containing protein [Chitinophagales bacterium]